MSSDTRRTEVEPVNIELRDGRHATLRAIHEGDGDMLQEAIGSLSVESRYYRFFSPMRRLPSNLLARATRPEPGRELQLVAVVGKAGHEKIVAGARYAALESEGDCEFAVAVVDEWHGLGLARRLLEMLIEKAHASGLQRMEGYVLANNTPMLRLAKRLGFAEMASSEGPSVRLVCRDLRSAR